MSFVKLRKSPPPHSLLLRVLIMNECWICQMQFLHMLIWSSNFSSLGCWCDGLWKWKWKVKVKVTQSCLTLCDPMDYLVHGILQVRILGWVAFPFSRGSSQPKDWTQVSRILGRFFTSWATSETRKYLSGQPIPSLVDLPYRNQTRVSCITGGLFTNWVMREAPMTECINWFLNIEPAMCT